VGRGGFFGGSVDPIAPAILLAVAVVVISGFHVFLESDDPRKSRLSRSVALGVVVALILIATLTTREAIGEEASLKVVPFVDLFRALAGNGSVRSAIAGLAANVLLFVPFGMALQLRYPNLSIAKVAAIAFSLSFAIETMQLLLAAGRVANSTDVLMNTLGGVVGAVVVRLLVAASADR